MRNRIFSLIPAIFIDIISRLAGWLYALIKPTAGFGAERRIRGIYWGMRLGSSGLHIGRNVQIETPSKIKVGTNSKLYCSGHYVSGRNGYIHIGSDTHIGRHSLISGSGGVTIGDRTAISSHFIIFSSSNDPYAKDLHKAPRITDAVKIGSDVFIGASVTILPGVTIGDGAVIGAGSMVKNNISANMIAAGSPAKILGKKDGYIIKPYS